jgi:hypothetical protein
MATNSSTKNEMPSRVATNRNLLRSLLSISCFQNVEGAKMWVAFLKCCSRRLF